LQDVIAVIQLSVRHRTLGGLDCAAPSSSRHPDSDVLVKWARNNSKLLRKPAFDCSPEADSAPNWLPRGIGGGWRVSEAKEAFVTSPVAALATRQTRLPSRRCSRIIAASTPTDAGRVQQGDHDGHVRPIHLRRRADEIRLGRHMGEQRAPWEARSEVRQDSIKNKRWIVSSKFALLDRIAVTVKEAAILIGTSDKQIRKAFLYARELPAARLGKANSIGVADLRRWFDGKNWYGSLLLLRVIEFTARRANGQ
jgi:hypothetical protein